MIRCWSTTFSPLFSMLSFLPIFMMTYYELHKMTYSYIRFCYQRIWTCLNPFPYDKIIDSTKLKEFADDNLKFNENGRKFS